MSRRVLISGLLAATLAACGEPPGLRFVSPDSGTAVSGRVEVVLQTAEPAASGPVALYGDDRILGTLLATGREYRHTLDVRAFGPGRLVLEAVPAAGSPVRTTVTVTGGGSSVGTPGSPPGGSLGGDPLNQQPLAELLPGLKGTSVGNALTYMPPGFPWGSLFTPSLGAALRTRLAPAQTAALPRGVYTFDELEQFWTVEDTAAGTLEVTFNYLDPVAGEPHDIKINLIWDQSSPTTTVLGLRGPLEVPTGAWLFVQDNETDILNVELTVAWLEPEACDTPVMIPETLTVAGWLLGPREAAFADAPTPRLAPQQAGGEGGGGEEGEEAEEEPDDQFENTGVRLEFSVAETPYGTRVFSQSYLTAVTREGLEVELGHILDTTGAAVWDGCRAMSFTPGNLALFLSSLAGPEGGDKTGAILSGTLLDVVFDGLRVPRSATLDRLEVTTLDDGVGETTVAEDGALTFSEADGFAATGTATVPGGRTRPLGAYLTSLFRAYWPRPAEAP